MKEKILIIGGVAAGPKAASRIMRVNPYAEVTIIDQDSLVSYGGCGIPYYVSGDVADEKELRSTNFHMLRDEFFFRQAKGVKVLTSTRATAINRQEKNVEVQQVETGEKQKLDYDKLLLATGSSPLVLPIAGTDLDGVFTISDLHKAIEIKDRVAKGKVGKVVVIGGGAIGIEMAEAFADLWGLETSIVEFMDQLLPRIVNWPMAAILAKHLRDHQVNLFLGEGAVEILGKNGVVTGLKTSKRTIEADMVIMAAGVRPRSELAKEAGLNVSAMGAIVVNQRMQTSDPNIYAAGDCVEIPHLVSGRRFFAPLGSLANKEGRVAGDNMAGIPTVFKGAVGAFIMKGFDMCIGAAGLSLEAALAEGFDADVSLTSPADRAHFFPGQEVACFELVFDKRTRRVLGFQGIGPMNDGISARIDAAAVSIANGAVIEDFANLEMAYAPPFSAAIDSINAAAYVASNICDGLMRKIDMDVFYQWMEDPSSHPDWVVLDVRHPVQVRPFADKFGKDLWRAMPYEQLRDRWAELPTDKTMIIFCNAGSRSYEMQRILDHHGRTNNLVLSGGFNVIKRIGGSWLP
ncbi:MAG: pyridine nucleotide-disulfide oxidoreductase [Deltaproteobacteria bacterium]|nr:MAG: pyridine nucleotide-disulfide oxidoreductase [Deltaproteobacteria bacterium]